MINLLFYVCLVLAPFILRAADSTVQEPYDDPWAERDYPINLELKLKGAVTVHNNLSKPIYFRVAGLNLCTDPRFEYSDDGTQTVQFYSNWCSKPNHIKAEKSATISYFFLKKKGYGVEILNQLALHWAFYDSDTNHEFQGSLPLHIYDNSRTMTVHMHGSDNDTVASGSVVYDPTLRCDYKKLMRCYLAPYIARLRKGCGIHRDAITMLQSCLVTEYPVGLGHNAEYREKLHKWPSKQKQWVNE